MVNLVHELISRSADRSPEKEALIYQGKRLTYAALGAEVERARNAMLALGLGRAERVAVYLEKRQEAVISLFAAAAAGGVFVPVNPLLKPEQVVYILRDCNVRILVTSQERLQLLTPVLSQCHDLHTVILVNATAIMHASSGPNVVSWEQALSCEEA
jgi:acyl-CoA synthetase (AMP-forming)/AMP-acid ligase II